MQFFLGFWHPPPHITVFMPIECRPIFDPSSPLIAHNFYGQHHNSIEPTDEPKVIIYKSCGELSLLVQHSRDIGICRCMDLVQTHKCKGCVNLIKDLVIRGPWLNSSLLTIFLIQTKILLKTVLKSTKYSWTLNCQAGSKSDQNLKLFFKKIAHRPTYLRRLWTSLL